MSGRTARPVSDRQHVLTAGVDEVGRGPLAGPVVVAAVILDPACSPAGLADSKTLTAPRREELYELIMHQALAVSFASACAARIDAFNIRAATLDAMVRAVDALALVPSQVLVDGRDVFACGYPCRAIVGGDGKEAAISAASIVAKVLRDRLMSRLGVIFPAYGFAAHAGYGTPAHRAAIARYGPCPAHRFSFAPIRGVWRRPT